MITLKGNPPLDLIPGVLRFTYVENRGAAFGMLADNRWVFLILSAITIICIIAFMIVSKPKNRLERAGLALILAGGVGNMIDRVMLGYVIDFIDFCAFPKVWAWVFNIADSCICIGVGLLVLYVIMLSVAEYKASKIDKNQVEAAVPDDVGGSGEHTVCHAKKCARGRDGDSGNDSKKEE